MKLRLLLLLSALFFMPLGARLQPPKGYPPFFTGQGVTLQVISPCKHCGVKSSTPMTLKKHIYIMHTTKVPLLWSCRYVGCGQEFATNKELMWHIESGRHDMKEAKMYKGCRRCRR